VIDGKTLGGIPIGLPSFSVPWSGEMAHLMTVDLSAVVRAAIAIALLGAIESLLSAVIADSMTNRRHHADGELVGQGLANIVAPWFGGFAATGALARTAANVRAGATSPIAAMIHAVFIALALLFLGPLLGWLPMASLAALLLVIAKNMTDFRHAAFVIRTAPRGDSFVLVICLALTVGMDMVVAVSVGVVLAALIFMRRMAELSGIDLGDTEGAQEVVAPPDVLYYRIRGPLFFGAAQRAMQEVRTSGVARCAVLDLSQVPMIDATGVVNLESAVDRLWRAGIPVIIAGANPTVHAAIKRARFPWAEEGATFAASADEVFKRVVSSK
jgi:SulP family sulfate permease